MKIWKVYCESAENSTCFDMFLCIGALDCRGESLETVAISNDFYMNFIITDYFQDCHVAFHVTCWGFTADLKWCLFFIFSTFLSGFFSEPCCSQQPTDPTGSRSLRSSLSCRVRVHVWSHFSPECGTRPSHMESSTTCCSWTKRSKPQVHCGAGVSFCVGFDGVLSQASQSPPK